MQTQNFSPEQDIAIFHHESAHRNYSHALYHLACALSNDPGQEDWLALADQFYVQHKDDVLKFFSQMDSEQQQYYAVVALHAYFLWKSGKYNDAIYKLTLVINAVSETYYFPWLAEWLFSLRDLSLLSPTIIFQIPGGCMNQMDFYAKHNGPEIYEKLLEFTQLLSEDTELPMDKSLVTSMLLRRLHRYDEALAAAKKCFEKDPTAINANFIALCYKEMEQLDEMEHYTRLSISINPSERFICNDMGDAFLEHENYQKAAEYYALVLEVGSDEWAEPSYYYSRFQLKEEDAGDMLNNLSNYYRENPENSRAEDLFERLYNQLFPEKEWFYNKIQYSHESITNLLQQISESYSEKFGSHLNSMNIEGSYPLRFAVSCLESPSAVNAFQLYLSDYGRKTADFTLFCKVEPDPPFLEPVAESGVSGTFRLWDYDEAYHFTPTVKPAGGAVLALVLHLASENYGLTDWYEKAKALADELSLSPSAREELEGAMVYPPRCPNEDYPMDCWLMRVQYSAVFLLAALDEKDGLLPSPSLKRILFGQIDWPVIPALTVLSYQTNLHEECSKEVYRLFTDFEKRIFNDSFCFFFFTYLVSRLNINGLDQEEHVLYKNQLRDIMSSSEEEEEEEDEEDKEEQLEALKDMLND